MNDDDNISVLSELDSSIFDFDNEGPPSLPSAPSSPPSPKVARHGSKSSNHSSLSLPHRKRFRSSSTDSDLPAPEYTPKRAKFNRWQIGGAIYGLTDFSTDTENKDESAEGNGSDSDTSNIFDDEDDILDAGAVEDGSDYEAEAVQKYRRKGEEYVSRKLGNSLWKEKHSKSKSEKPKKEVQGSADNETLKRKLSEREAELKVKNDRIRELEEERKQLKTEQKAGKETLNKSWAARKRAEKAVQFAQEGQESAETELELLNDALIHKMNQVFAIEEKNVDMRVKLHVRDLEVNGLMEDNNELQGQLKEAIKEKKHISAQLKEALKERDAANAQLEELTKAKEQAKAYTPQVPRQTPMPRVARQIKKSSEETRKSTPKGMAARNQKTLSEAGSKPGQKSIMGFFNTNKSQQDDAISEEIIYVGGR